MGMDVTARSANGPAGPATERLLRAFAQANRRIVLPMLRYPAVHDWLGSPALGYFAVLTTLGRRSGLPRETPLNYALLDGGVYLLAGFGPRSDWYRNLCAHPAVTVRLPGRTFHGTATPVTDSDEAARAAVAVARNSGFALVFEGLRPIGTTDEELRRQFAGRPVVRVDVAGGPVEPGRHDPGSPWWMLPHVVAPTAVAALAGPLRPAVSRRLSERLLR